MFKHVIVVIKDAASFRSSEIQLPVAQGCHAIWPPAKYIPFYSRMSPLLHGVNISIFIFPTIRALFSNSIIYNSSSNKIICGFNFLC